MKTLQLLCHPKKKKNGKVYKYYSIVEPYYDKETKKNNKKVLWYIGKLSDEKAEQIRRDS